MKIAIVGPGAVGLLFAAFFSRAKEDVWILDKNPERCQKLKKSGFKVTGATTLDVQNVKFSCQADELKNAQFWFICTKSYDTKDAIKNISKSVSDSAHVISLQNGIGNLELLAEAFPPERILAAVTNMAALRDENGLLKHTGTGETVIGSMNATMGVALKDLRALFQKSGTSLKITKDIKSYLWTKLIINAAINPLSAIIKLNNGSINQFEGARRIFADTIAEAVKVAKRKKIKLVYDDMQVKAEAVCQATAENSSSMLQDVLRRRKTEIDFINGAIVRQGKSLGIKTPVNFFLYNLIKTIEESYSLQVDKK